MNSFNSATLALVFIDHRERQDAEYRSRTDRERTDHISRRTRDLEGEERGRRREPQFRPTLYNLPTNPEEWSAHQVLT